MVMLLIKSELSLNGSDAKTHTRADTRVLSDALRSMGRTYRPAPWARSHTSLTWTTAEEEFIARKRYFT